MKSFYSLLTFTFYMYIGIVMRDPPDKISKYLFAI